jgi:nudix-type nucleoside diphosphatase (YffH/AdpP family)
MKAPMPHKAVIERQRRLFDDFFKVDEFLVAHEQIDGDMGATQRQLVFERGDAAAVLIFNADRRAVVLVEQFRMATLVGRRRDDPHTTNGWIVETVAGMVDAGETPEVAAIRETREETGYHPQRVELIGKFFASPGGSSERFFLYFAEVSDADRIRTGGGVDGEDIRIVHMPTDELFDRLAQGKIDDAKLYLAAYWLKSRLQLAVRF